MENVFIALYLIPFEILSLDFNEGVFSVSLHICSDLSV